MAYHESFWIVVGTAAPVIALANVVTISDAMFFLRGDDVGRSLGLYNLAALNLLAQATAMVLAFMSLDGHGNVVPPALAIVLTAAGLVLLIFTNVIAGGLRRKRDRPTCNYPAAASPSPPPEPPGPAYEGPAQSHMPPSSAG
jgi:hypothetical protein